MSQNFENHPFHKAFIEIKTLVDELSNQNVKSPLLPPNLLSEWI